MIDDVLHEMLIKSKFNPDIKHLKRRTIDALRIVDDEFREYHNLKQRERYHKQRVEYKERLKTSKAKEFFK